MTQRGAPDFDPKEQGGIRGSQIGQASQNASNESRACLRRREGAQIRTAMPSRHIHIVLGLADGSTRGGRLLAGTVRPTLEVVLTEVPATLRRKKRADLGIALIDLAAGRG
jgi:hypothetical protein